MKIAINTRFLLPENLEGIGTFSYEIVKRLIEKNPQHHFYLLFDRKWDKKYEFGKNSTNIEVKPPARHPILWKIWFEYSVPKTLKKIKADVFLSLDGYTSIRSKIKKITVFHDLAFEHYPNDINKIATNFLQKNSIKYAQTSDKIIAVSEATKQDIIEEYAIDESKIEVVYNAVNTNFGTENLFDAKEKYANNQPYFLYVGAIHPRKNIENLLLAFDQFRKNNFRKFKLLIVGRKAWKFKSVEEAYENMTFKKDVIFTGFVEKSELPSLYASAFATIYISYFEGFGIPIIESQKCGTPVITSNISSMPEVAGEGAILVNPFDVKIITSALGEMVNVPGLRDKLAEKGLKNVARFSWDKSAEKIMQLIESNI